MPEPSRTHAEQIAFERALMQSTGMTRTQLRKELKAFGRQQQQLTEARDAVLLAAGAVRRAVEVRETKLAPVVEKLETGVVPAEATPVFVDATNPTNSGAGAAVLKTGTNVIARTLVGTLPIVVTPGTDDIVISYSGSGYTLAVKQAGATIVAAASAMNFAESSALADILVITDAGGGQATLTFNRLEWIGCSSGSPVYVEDYSYITGPYP